MNAIPFIDLVPYLILIGGLVGASAFFSGTEVAMFSLRRVDRAQMARSKRSVDALALRLLARPRRLIATLLIGNESVNVSISAAMAGLCELLFKGQVGEVTLALLAILFGLPLLLLFGEITPKTLAFKTAAGWTRAAARPLWGFGVLVAPIRIIVRAVAEIIVRPFGGSIERASVRDLSEEEFKALVDAGSAEGEVDARERRLIHRVFEFGDKRVADAMVPRDRVFALSYDLPVSRLIREIANRGFSRVPIYHRTLDKIQGILYAKDLVIQGTGLSAPRRLQELLHQPLFVVQTMPLERLFDIFKKRRIHMAIVVNEYGNLAGLVTMEDLLEELFGEIRDERELQKSLASRLRVPTEPMPAPSAAGAAEQGKEGGGG